MVDLGVQVSRLLIRRLSPRAGGGSEEQKVCSPVFCLLEESTSTTRTSQCLLRDTYCLPSLGPHASVTPALTMETSSLGSPISALCLSAELILGVGEGAPLPP